MIALFRWLRRLPCKRLGHNMKRDDRVGCGYQYDPAWRSSPEDHGPPPIISSWLGYSCRRCGEIEKRERVYGQPQSVVAFVQGPGLHYQ